MREKREHSAKGAYYRPELFVFDVRVPTLMEMEGCTASVDSRSQLSICFYEGCFFLRHDFTCNDRVGMQGTVENILEKKTVVGSVCRAETFPPFIRAEARNTSFQKLHLGGCTDWFKLKTSNSSIIVQCPRRFLEIDPEILHRCLICPCRAFDECVCVFLFSPGMWVFIFLRDNRVLRDPTFPAKKTETKTPFVKGSAGTR